MKKPAYLPGQMPVDINLILPANNATLSGDGTDTGGTIAAYQWSVVLAVPKAFAKLFPNPATSTINIQIEGARRTSNMAMRIYDNKGFLVYQGDFVRPPQPIIKQVNESRLPGGIYFVELQTNTNNITMLSFMKK